jgi:hypothetical protein
MGHILDEYKYYCRYETNLNLVCIEQLLILYYLQHDSSTINRIV